jgi:hypothetical protein
MAKVRWHTRAPNRWFEYSYCYYVIGSGLGRLRHTSCRGDVRMRKSKNRNSGRSIRLRIVVLSIALVPLISGTAFAQTAAEDQYPGSTGIGLEAADDALKASGAFDPAPSGAAVLAAVSEPQVALAEEPQADPEPQADSAGTPAITRLPNTGGPSLLSLGGLLVVGGLLVRGVARRALDR